MKLTAYNAQGRLTWFGLPMWAEMTLMSLVGLVIMTAVVFLPGCGEEVRQSSTAVPPSKYRIVHIYGADRIGSQYGIYYADDVKYDGPWVRFYDKDRRQWTKVSGMVLIEGGEN